MRVIITDANSLQRVLWLKRRTQVVLAFPTLSTGKRAELEARFHRHLADSGGRFSTLFLAGCLAGCLLFDLDQRALFAVHPVSLVTVNIVLCAFAILFGKLFGLLRARWQLARLIGLWPNSSKTNPRHSAARTGRVLSATPLPPAASPPDV